MTYGDQADIAKMNLRARGRQWERLAEEIQVLKNGIIESVNDPGHGIAGLTAFVGDGGVIDVRFFHRLFSLFMSQTNADTIEIVLVEKGRNHFLPASTMQVRTINIWTHHHGVIDGDAISDDKLTHRILIEIDKAICESMIVG